LRRGGSGKSEREEMEALKRGWGGVLERWRRSSGTGTVLVVVGGRRSADVL
jgi:hypothetical protein